MTAVTLTIESTCYAAGMARTPGTSKPHWIEIALGAKDVENIVKVVACGIPLPSPKSETAIKPQHKSVTSLLPRA